MESQSELIIQNKEQKVVISQQTPQGPQTQITLELKFQEDLKQCDKEMQNRLPDVFSVKLFQIKGAAQEIVNQIIKNDKIDDESIEKIESIKSIIINNKVMSVIKAFKEKWTNSLNEFLKKTEFQFDLGEWIQENQINDYASSCDKILQKLDKINISLPKKANKDEIYGISEIYEINQFLIALQVKLIQFYIIQQFKGSGLINEYYDEYLDLIKNLNDLVLSKFKSTFKDLWQLIQNSLSIVSESIKPLIEESAILFSNNNSTQYQQKTKEELNQTIQDSFQQFLRNELQIEDYISQILYQEQLESIQNTIDQVFGEQILKVKKAKIEEHKLKFDEYMKQISKKGNLTCRIFKSMNNQQIFDIINYIIYYTSISNNQENKMMKEIINKLIQSNQEFEQNPIIDQLQLMVSDDCHLYNIVKGQIINILKEGAANTILYLNLKSIEEILTIMAQLYMLISNINVKEDQKIIEIQPYYGSLQSIRSQLLKSFSKHFSKHDINFFFDYLDTYFESKFIYQLGTYSLGQNIPKTFGYQIKLQDNHQDYDILHLLRTETDKQSLDHLEQIKKKFKNALQHIKLEHNKQSSLPSFFHLVKVSGQQISRNIIIVVSGFTSQDEDKQIKWQKVAQFYPNSEVYALEYSSQSLNDVANQAKSSVIQSLLFPGGKVLKTLQFVYQSVVDNPFRSAFNQAELTGQYLAHLLYKGNLFPNCSISLIGFSLGTQVISSCLHEYKRILPYNNPSMISQVLFMGGVADINYIKRNNILDVVQYRVFNCYTNNDLVLKYALRLSYLFSQPIGLKPIQYHKQNGCCKIIDLDFTQTINGHLPFMNNLTNVLQKTDFNQEHQSKEIKKPFQLQQEIA